MFECNHWTPTVSYSFSLQKLDVDEFSVFIKEADVFLDSW